MAYKRSISLRLLSSAGDNAYQTYADDISMYMYMYLQREEVNICATIPHTLCHSTKRLLKHARAKYILAVNQSLPGVMSFVSGCGKRRRNVIRHVARLGKCWCQP